jgi:hypothetical protein
MRAGLFGVTAENHAQKDAARREKHLPMVRQPLLVSSVRRSRAQITNASQNEPCGPMIVETVSTECTDVLFQVGGRPHATKNCSRNSEDAQESGLVKQCRGHPVEQDRLFEQLYTAKRVA